MNLQSITLQNFRNYTKRQFTFEENVTVFLGPNGIGKTNVLEAIYLLATGDSFKTEKDIQLTTFEKEITRVTGKTVNETLEVVLASGDLANNTFSKRYLVNGVARRVADFAGHITVVLFSPADLDIVTGSPGQRRRFLDQTISQVDHEYRISLASYTKAIRQRNALLEQARETGVHNAKLFSYWDQLVITHGNILTKKREEFIEFSNAHAKEIMNMTIVYDRSEISIERLEKYAKAEIGAGVTLVGPHRDDFYINMYDKKKQPHDLKFFGSRGQQRLGMLQLKLLQLAFMEKATLIRPLLLLDDIFSELDENHIDLVFKMTEKQQTFLTTTHEEFLPNRILGTMQMVTLGE